MKRFSYRDRDYAFGQAMLTLRSAIGLTQSGLAEYLGVSRRAVGEWEAGGSYPKAENLKQFIALAIEHQAFPAGRELEEIRQLWQAARQKVLLDEGWLAALLTPQSRAAATPPFQTTSFIGRGAELTELATIIANSACRLLTLIGPGGIGKTRLAMEIASRQSAAFTDGVAFVSLAPVSTPAQIVSAIGDTLGLSFTGQMEPAQQLIGYLREWHLLLVLDNFEHLLPGAQLVYEILANTARVKLLVTSRERLNLQAEWLFDVEGLAYPPAELRVEVALRSPADIANYSAARLFVQRATQVQPGFAVTEATLTSIVRICQQVAGMPLAIELAAAGVQVMPVADIESHIRSNLDMLATTLRDVPARHRSMRAVFNHSWDGLGEPEQVLWSRLAVFRGGCTADAAQQITGAGFAALKNLVNKSLLRQENSPNPQAELRFVLLEPIRDYALERLSARQEMPSLQRAHAAYYLALAETVSEQWDSPTVAIEQIDRDYDNLRAALQWACAGGDLAIGFRLCVALRKYWQRRGLYSEGRAWLADLLAQDAPAVLDARIHGMNTAAWLATDQHDYTEATKLFEESAALREMTGRSDADETFLPSAAARQARAAGQYQRATALFEDALSRHRVLGDRGGMSTAGIGLSLYELGLVLREQGEYARAAALFEECVQLHREIGDREGITVGLMGLADVMRDQADAAGTRHYSEQSLAIARDLGMQWAIGFSLNNLATAYYLEGDLTRAYTFASEGIALFRSLHAEGSAAEVLITLGQILQARGDEAAAREALIESLQIAWGVGPRLLMAAALECLAGMESVPLSLHFLAAASALRVKMGITTRPIDRARVEPMLAAARLSLDSNSFAAEWEAVYQKTLADESWLATLLPLPQVHSEPPPVEEVVSAPSANGGPRLDWSDALAVPVFYGRERDLDMLTEWVIGERCRVISVLGLGGIGKSALAVSLMYRVAEQFDVVIWRSLRDIPDCDALLDDLLRVMAPQSLAETTLTLERRQSLVLEQMRSTRALLVFDNVDSTLDEGENAGRLRPGYEGIGRFLRLSAETGHQSCVLLTSREKPSDLLSLEGSRSPVRTLRLARLAAEACELLLDERKIAGTPAERAWLIDTYAGNPLALNIVAQTIVELFAGEIAPFLEQGEVIFGGVRELLREQFMRLSALEQSVLLWLAILREPSTLDELFRLLVTPVPRARLLEAVEALRRRSLVERGQKQGNFALQSVVMEFATAWLITEASGEIQQGKLVRLIQHGLSLAQMPEYIRQTQDRLIVTPILAQLRSSYSQPAVEEQLLTLLNHLSSWSEDAQGYGPANLVALLRLHRGDLRGLDLSGLALRGMYLQGVAMQDANLSQARIWNSIFTEAFDVMTAVAISRDGELWAAASRRGEVRVWGDSGMTLHRAWQAHDDMVMSIIFSPDGRRLMTSGSAEGVVKLWDVATGTLLWAGSHPKQAYRVAGSPDGRLLASSGNDAAVRLWNMATRMQIDTLAHSGPVIAVCWSPDGTLLASGDEAGCIRLWQIHETAASTCIQTIIAHTARVDGLAFSPDGRTLASAGWDGTVKLWDVPGGDLLETLTAHMDRVRSAVWSPDGSLLASCGFEKMIWLWDVEQRDYRGALQGHSAGLYNITFTPDSQHLLSCAEDDTLRLWDVMSGQCLRVMQGYGVYLYDVDWSPDSAQVAGVGSDSLVTIYDVTRQTPTRMLSGHNRVIYGVRWSPDGRWIASSEWDNQVRLWDTISGACLRVLQHPGDSSNFFDGVAWSPDGTRLAASTYTWGLEVFDLTVAQPQWASRPFPTWIHRVVWSPNGALLAGGGDDGGVYIWDAEDNTLLQHMTGHQGMVWTVAWSPGGTLIASGGGSRNSGELFIWDALHGGLVQKLVEHPGTVYAIAWDITGEVLISGSSDGRLRWWEVSSGQAVRIVDAHTGTVQALRRSPDGTMLASCGDDGAIMIWNLRTGEHLRTLRRDRPYERLNITGIRGLTDAQKATLRALGAVDHA